MTVALGGRDPINFWVGLPLGRNRVMHGGIGMHWKKMNTHIPNIAVSETSFLGILVQC